MTDNHDDAIAIVGLSIRAPKAASVSEFWHLLADGRNALLDPVPEPALASASHEHFVPVRGRLEGIDMFDAAFFGIRASEARLMDPQQRVFLECAWEAMESAGGLHPSSNRRAGVFASSGYSTYLADHVGPARPQARDGDRLEMLIANDKDFLAARVAYKLDLKGPAVTVQTACSSSLAAIHLAAQSLLLGDCDIALAGGVSIDTRGELGYTFEPGLTFSPDGVVRSFDRNAAGTVPSAGAGVVVLKRLADALRDGDLVYATLLGSAISNDGGARVGMTAPTSDGVARAARDALTVAGVDPRDVGYIEAHGSGTPLGDRTELRGLLEAYPSSSQPAVRWIGSVKTNVGHLDVAAGVAGFVKATLALYHGRIPPSLNCRDPIEDLGSGLRVASQSIAWPRTPGRPRLAAVSSMGLGGHNVHAILGEAPPRPVPEGLPCGPLLVGWSARSDAALQAFELRLVECFRRDPTLDPALAARMLLVTRPTWGHRRAVIVEGADAGVAPRFVAEPISGSSSDPARVRIHINDNGDCLPIPMGTADKCLALREARDEGLSILRRIAGPRVADQAAHRLAHGATGQPTQGTPREETLALHAARTIRVLAVARQFMAWGLSVDGFSGTGAGDLAAATLEGQLTPEEALRLVLLRAETITQETGHDTAAIASRGEPSGRSAFMLALAEFDHRPALGGRLQRWRSKADSVRESEPSTAEPALADGVFCLDIGPRGVALRGQVAAAANGHAEMLHALATLWVHGAEVDWELHFRELPAYAVELPPTVFQRESYWIAKLSRATAERLPEDTHVAAWPVQELPKDGSAQPRSRVADITLDGDFHTCLIGTQRISVAEVGALTEAAHAHVANVARCAVGVELPRGTQATVDAAVAAAEALRLLARTLAAAGLRELVVHARDAFLLRRQDAGHPLGQMLAACAVALDRQFPGLSCAFVDTNNAGADELASLLERLPASGSFAWRDGRLHRRTLAPAVLPIAPPALLREGSTYLVTGGRGRLGRVLCSHLAAAYGATVLTVGRSASDAHQSGCVPDRGKVIHLLADATCARSMRAAIAGAGISLASVRGVFHLAGVAGQAAVVDLDATSNEAELRRQLEPRCEGLLAVEELFANSGNVFKVLFSSTATVFGGHGLYAYSAACAFAEAQAEMLTRGGRRWATIGWDFWNIADAAAGNELEVPHVNALGADAALALLDHALFEGQSSTLFCLYGDLAQRLEDVRSIKSEFERTALSRQATGVTLPPPATTSPEQIEVAMIELWSRLLGEQVRADSDFFALGGDSMLAVRLAAAIRETWNARLPMAEIAQHATPRKLSQALAATLARSSAADAQPPVAAQGRAAHSLRDLAPALNGLSAAVIQQVCDILPHNKVNAGKAMLHQYMLEYVEGVGDAGSGEPGSIEGRVGRLSQLDAGGPADSNYAALAAAIGACGPSLAAAMQQRDVPSPERLLPASLVYQSLPESLAAWDAGLGFLRSTIERLASAPLEVLWVGQAPEHTIRIAAGLLPAGSRMLVVEPAAQPHTHGWPEGVACLTGAVDDAAAQTSEVADRSDIIVCAYSLSSARVLERTLATLAARLADGGALICLEIVVNEPWHLVALGGSPRWLCCADFRSAEPGPHLSWPKWRKLLAQAGLDAEPQPGEDTAHQIAFAARRSAS